MRLNLTTRRYLEELQANPHVLSIFLFGSWARGNQRPDSDVDLLVIAPEGFRHVVDQRAEQSFELIYTTEQGALDFWQASPDEAFEFWTNAKILFDRDGTAARLQTVGQQILTSHKPPLTPEQITHHRFDAYDQVRAIEGLAERDPTTAKMLLSFKIFQLVELYFDLRQRWRPPPKQRLVVLQHTAPELYNLLVNFYETVIVSEQIKFAKSIVVVVFGSPIPA